MRRGLIFLAIFIAFVAIYTLSRHAIGPTTTSTTIPSTTTTVVSSTSTIPASAMCQGSGFSGVYNEGEGAAGTIYASITLTKATPGTCSVKGWPILTLQDKTGAILPINLSDIPSGNNAVRFSPAKANDAPTMLVLRQGSAVNFSLAYQDVPTNNTVCDNALTVNVQFSTGGSSVPLTPPSAVQPCDNGKVWISPFY
ncbi:MAG: DUF4232 domain-containing protein [Acidimicrobiales bacterium]